MTKGKLVGLLGALGSLVYFMAFHWGRFLQDFWPIDNSRVGPNITAAAVQYAVIGIGLYLLYPPVRRSVDRWISGHLHSEQAVIHAKLDHIIQHHPDIPPFTAGSTPSGSPATPDQTSPAGSKSEAPANPESQPH